MSEKGWIGVDLDATLAKYDGFKGMQHIGEPIPAMAERVRQWLEAGHEVRILTARVCSTQTPVDRMIAQETIRAWTVKHFGVEIPSTSEKDYEMWQLWDDRCRQVIPNTGIAVESVDNTQALKSYKWRCADVNCATPCTLDTHCKGFERPHTCPFTQEPVSWEKIEDNN